jgi:hypothetical protein
LGRLPDRSPRRRHIRLTAAGPNPAGTLSPVDSDHWVCPDGLVEKDCPIYRAAHARKADVLLTGDIRDFGFLVNVPDKTEGLLIQTVADFLDSF